MKEDECYLEPVGLDIELSEEHNEATHVHHQSVLHPEGEVTPHHNGPSTKDTRTGELDLEGRWGCYGFSKNSEVYVLTPLKQLVLIHTGVVTQLNYPLCFLEEYPHCKLNT